MWRSLRRPLKTTRSGAADAKLKVYFGAGRRPPILSRNNRGRCIQRDSVSQLSIQLIRRGKRQLNRQGLASCTVIDGRTKELVEFNTLTTEKDVHFFGVNCVYGGWGTTSPHQVELRRASSMAQYAP